jgi:hypothetical protein
MRAGVCVCVCVCVCVYVYAGGDAVLKRKTCMGLQAACSEKEGGAPAHEPPHLTVAPVGSVEAEGGLFCSCYEAKKGNIPPYIHIPSDPYALPRSCTYI